MTYKKYVKCKYCKITFKRVRNDKRLIYCSKKCREDHWYILNPEKYYEHVKNAKLAWKKRNPKFCKECNKKIINRTNGKSLCSKKCIKKRRFKTMLKHRNKCKVLFHKYKTKLGCRKCGYDKYGGSLDFHHLDPLKKDTRITATHWVSKSIKIKEELKKCILVCKNCHHEIHEKMRNKV